MKEPASSQKLQLIASLRENFSPDRIIQEFENALAATTVAKNGCCYPDSRTRLAAIQLLMAYLEGRPIERQQVATLKHAPAPDEDLMARMKRSPALRRLIRRQLEMAESG